MLTKARVRHHLINLKEAFKKKILSSLYSCATRHPWGLELCRKAIPTVESEVLHSIRKAGFNSETYYIMPYIKTIPKASVVEDTNLPLINSYWQNGYRLSERCCGLDRWLMWFPRAVHTFPSDSLQLPRQLDLTWQALLSLTCRAGSALSLEAVWACHELLFASLLPNKPIYSEVCTTDSRHVWWHLKISHCGPAGWQVATGLFPKLVVLISQQKGSVWLPPEHTI